MKVEAGAQVTPNVRLLRPLGEGGMGAVWVAEHVALGTEVAVKFLLGDYAQDPAARARFSQEAAAASQVKSSHVVKVYDYGIVDDVPFIVMEMLEGTDLAKRLEAEKKIAPSELLPIIAQLCRALERAHEKNVIHRDIKPENVFLASEGGEVFAKLLDFGIAKTETVLRKTTGNRRSTMAGESLGTPYYMSPEQFKSAKQIDHRSDLWSVGVLVYEALTGRLPFEAETVSGLAIVVNEAKAAPPSSVEPSLPVTLDAWFAKACARDPNERFQSARELSSALRLALGSPAESPASTSGPQRVVISHVSVGEAEHLSLRDTAFATSDGGSTTRRERRRFPLIAGVFLFASLAVGVGVWAHSKTTTDQPKPPPTVASVASTNMQPSIASATPSSMSSATIEPAGSNSTSTPSAPSAPSTPNGPSTSHTGHAVHGSPPASTSSTKGSHGDIW